MKKIWRKLTFFCILMFFASLLVPLVFAQESEAEFNLASAEQKLVNCYLAAREAEAAGADISSLTVELTGAGELLSQAELAFLAGDFDSAINFGSRSQQALDGFVREANLLRFEALQQTNLYLLLYAIGTVAGVLVVIGVGFVVWFWLKRRLAASGVIDV